MACEGTSGKRSSPPQPRRGGRDTKKRLRSLLAGAAGVVLARKIESDTWATTPSARARDASRYFLSAQPPLLIQGGELALPENFFAAWQAAPATPPEQHLKEVSGGT